MMKKLPGIFLILGFFFFCLPTKALAQNKAGINIGDHFGDFDQAAVIVGPGGWVVVMACPGDGDTIAAMISKHPEINLVIRGHYPGQSPDENTARQWAATLATLPTSNKIFFMPWNEPNEEKSNDHVSQGQLDQYIRSLVAAIRPIRSRVFLLSPMMNITNPNYDSYVLAFMGGPMGLIPINSDFFNQFDGIAFSLYDTCDRCADAHRNPLLSHQQLLANIRASGKPIFGVEAGTMATDQKYYFTSPTDARSPLYNFVASMLQSSSEIRMFAIPAYDLAGEVNHTWDLFEMTKITELLASAPNGPIYPGTGATSASLRNCPGKSYAFYVSNSAEECGQCGTTVSYCKPYETTTTFGEEISRESIYIPEQATYRRSDSHCLAATFQGKIEISDFKIPFARNLNKYFLGSLVDNPKDRLNLTPDQVLKEAGLFNKLAPEEVQNNLKLAFLDTIASPNYQTNKYALYVGFQIEGKSPAEIATKFREWNPSRLQGVPLNDEQKKFFQLIWPQVPLFANEESRGHVVFFASGIDQADNILDTSVPEIYRLNNVTSLVQKMVIPAKPTPTQVAQGPNNQGVVLADEVCPVTSSVVTQTNNKEGQTGQGTKICTKPEIQPTQRQERQFAGKREWVNDAAKECKGSGSGQIEVSYGWTGPLPDNKCCGGNGNYVQTSSNGLNGDYAVYYYNCLPCNPGTAENPSTCWYIDGGETKRSDPDCCVPNYAPKTKLFTDTNLYSINKVPFLDQVIKNTVTAPDGLFNIFVINMAEAGQIRTSLPVIKNVFREVVGESASQVKIDIDRIQKIPTGYEDFKIGDSSTHGVVQGKLTLLFHWLGTLINVKDFVSQKELVPAAGTQ